MNNIQLNNNIKYKFFDRNHIEEHTLSLFLGKDELSYCIKENATANVLLLKSFRLSGVENFFTYKLLVKDFFDQEALPDNFQSVQALLNFAPYTLVPDTFFDAGKVEKYFTLNHSIENGGRLQTDAIDTIKAHIIYAVDYYVMDVLEDAFPQVRLQHSATAFLSQIYRDLPYNSGKTMWVNMQKKHIDLAALNDGNLQLFNTYYYETPADLLYYLLNVAQQTGFERNENTLTLSGDITPDFPNYKICEKYFKQIRLARRPVTQQYCQELDVLPQQYHYNLFAVG